MRFTLALLAGTATASFFGSPVENNAALVKRDGPTVTSAIAAIQAGTNSLAAAVSGFNGIGDAAGLQSAASSVISTIQAQNELVAASSELTQAEALALIDPINALAAAVQSAVTATINKKPTFDAAGVSSIVSSTLVQLRDLASTFSTTTIGKVPAALQDAARQLAAPIAASLQSGVDAFAGSGSSTTPSGSATASATATGSTSFSSTFALTSTTRPAVTGSANNTAGATMTARPTANGTATKPVGPIFTGAADIVSAAGFGAMAMAVVAAVAAM